jgi:hypothetical protein
MMSRLKELECNSKNYRNENNIEQSASVVYELLVKHSLINKKERARLIFEANITKDEPIEFLRALYQSNCQLSESVIDLSIGLEKDIEYQFLLLHKVVSQKEGGNAVLNKLRLTIFIHFDSYKYKFESKYDSDFDWLESADKCHMSHLGICPEEKSRILEWDGLPANYFRYWIN